MNDFEYDYAFSSLLKEDSDRAKEFIFSHCSELAEDKDVPCYFWGDMRHSFLVAKCLSTLAKVVRSHFAITPDAKVYLRDPIISVGNQRLLFEAFSSCNSVYTRVNIHKDGLDGDFLQSGCTNIDFNDQSVRAFNSVSASERLLLSIGAKQTQIITETKKSIEKKVALPDRWIKGLGNVQVYLSEMELAYRLSKMEAIQLFKSLPKTPVKQDYYLVKRGIYSFSPVATPNAVKIGGIHRLNVLQNLLLLCESVFVYRNESEQSVAFVVNFKDMDMLFLLSDSVFRGFSGEGRTLESMTNAIPMDWVIGLNTFFKTNETFNPTMVAIENNIALSTMNTLQSTLSSLGLLGYNPLDNSYFYRRLPFKLQRLLKFNPRLENARKLNENNEVQIIKQSANYIKAEVKGTADVKHIVIGDGLHYQCTCNWYTNHKTHRGLCKHILAVKILVENQE